MNKQDAIARLDALDAEAKALRAIIEAEPKKEPRGLCWVSDCDEEPDEGNEIDLITTTMENGRYRNHRETNWRYATPLTDAELQEYRGRWE